ncbi:hypothetical protein JCGZ_25492 [Jatropha curcas]|uniref:Uncharacterized protein n=1 Tax=Jatropha curcas TaxID=180498 RepID=A0A067JPM8_JATCU|nr:hypothetical protein JCGZ_25492 [Jatropha curcas]
MVPPAPNVAPIVLSLGTGGWVLHLVVSEHRSLVMSQHPSDEKVDSYAPLGGSIPAGGAAGGV